MKQRIALACALGLHVWDYYGPLMFPRKRCIRCGVRRDAL